MGILKIQDPKSLWLRLGAPGQVEESRKATLQPHSLLDSELDFDHLILKQRTGWTFPGSSLRVLASLQL